MELTKDNKKIKFIIITSIIVIILITSIIIVSINSTSTKKDKKEENQYNIEQEKINKNNFKDVASNFLKAAETSYVEEYTSYGLKSDNKYNLYTINELNDKYFSETTYTNEFSKSKGCVIVEINDNGDVINKYIYITNNNYMIYNSSDKDIINNSEKVIEKYNRNKWKNDYEKCYIDNYLNN